MKRTLLVVAAALSLSACAEGGYGHGPYFGGDTVFYDDAYGPIYDGYWGDDGMFYYSGSRGRPYVRDEAHHFRRDQSNGFHSFHTHGGSHGFHGGGAAGGAGAGGGHGDGGHHDGH